MYVVVFHGTLHRRVLRLVYDLSTEEAARSAVRAVESVICTVYTVRRERC